MRNLETQNKGLVGDISSTISNGILKIVDNALETAIETGKSVVTTLTKGVGSLVLKAFQIPIKTPKS